MPNATFYIVNDDTPQAQSEGFLAYVVFLAQYFAKQGAKVYINGDNQIQASRSWLSRTLNEALIFSRTLQRD